jgi:phosphopantothenoylcysteine decarboxylase/phosphopantothenate--cysteine ligase
MTFQALTGKPVITDLWDASFPNHMAHIELSRGADAILVAPASADFLAKLAHGLADDLLSTACLARNCPLLVAPAMNREMWDNAATQRNIATLRGDGVAILGPDSGDQACGEVGMGRLLEPEELAQGLLAFFAPKRLAGRKVLVTAGPTFEAIDTVRGITNLSSGRMGYAIAEAVASVGRRRDPRERPHGARAAQAHFVYVTTAAEMFSAVTRVADPDYFFSVAAVARLHARATSGEAQEDRRARSRLKPEDILAVLRSPTPFCVGFAAEAGPHASPWRSACQKIDDRREPGAASGRQGGERGHDLRRRGCACARARAQVEDRLRHRRARDAAPWGTPAARDGHAAQAGLVALSLSADFRRAAG